MKEIDKCSKQDGHLCSESNVISIGRALSLPKLKRVSEIQKTDPFISGRSKQYTPPSGAFSPTNAAKYQIVRGPFRYTRQGESSICTAVTFLDVEKGTEFEVIVKTNDLSVAGHVLSLVSSQVLVAK